MESAILGAVSLYIGILLLGLLVLAILYVLCAIGLYWIAKAEGFGDKAFLAWIPLANVWLIGEIAGQYPFFGYKLDNCGVIYLAAQFLIPFCLSFISLVSLAGFVCSVLSIIVTANVIERYYASPLNWVLSFIGGIGIFVAGLRAKNAA